MPAGMRGDDKSVGHTFHGWREKAGAEHVKFIYILLSRRHKRKNPAMPRRRPT